MPALTLWAFVRPSLALACPFHTSALVLSLLFRWVTDLSAILAVSAKILESTLCDHLT